MDTTGLRTPVSAAMSDMDIVDWRTVGMSATVARIVVRAARLLITPLISI